MADQIMSTDVDLLSYVDPTMEKSDLTTVKDKFRDRVALAGGISSAVTLFGDSREGIRKAVHTAVQQLGPRGFILAPVSSLTPDTPWSSVETMIEAWKEVRD